MHRYTFTPSGLSEREAELAALQKQRPDALAEMVRMRELGDLSENAGYRAARSRVTRIDNRIRYLRHVISRASVVRTTSSSEIILGSTVHLVDRKGAKRMFMLVAPHEADLAHHKLSIHSPLGKALMGKRAGAVVSYTTSSGVHTYTIESHAIV